MEVRGPRFQIQRDSALNRHAKPSSRFACADNPAEYSQAILALLLTPCPPRSIEYAAVAGIVRVSRQRSLKEAGLTPCSISPPHRCAFPALEPLISSCSRNSSLLARCSITSFANRNISANPSVRLALMSEAALPLDNWHPCPQSSRPRSPPPRDSLE